MINYILVFIAVIGLALQFSTNKYYQLKCGSSLVASSRLSALNCAIAVIAFLCINKFQFNVTPFSFVMAFGVAAICCIYNLIGFKIIAIGSVAVYTMFLMLGGMLLPYVFGVVFLNEQLSMFRVIGLLLLITAMIIPCTANDKTDKKSITALYIILCSVVFVMNGFVSIFSKVHQVETSYATVTASDFVLLTNVINLVLSAVIYTFAHLKHKKKHDEHPKLPIKLWHFFLISFAATFFTAGSYLLQLIGAANLPASVLYPMITGGSIVLTAIAAYILFKENPEKRSQIGLYLAFVATFLFLF